MQQHSSDVFPRRSIKQFERLYQEGSTITGIMAVSLRPYISRVPHRIGYLEQLCERSAICGSLATVSSRDGPGFGGQG